MLTAEEMLARHDQHADRTDAYADALEQVDPSLAAVLHIHAQQERADRDQWARIIQHLTTQESQ